MLKSILLGISLVCLPAPPPATATSANMTAVDTVRVGFVKDRPAALNMSSAGIRVEGYRFARAVRGTSNTFKMHQSPSIVFDVTGDGTFEKNFGIAVALFDASGRLVGASSARHKGKLDPGKREEIKVEFEDVNQDLHRAATVFMTLELER